MRERDLVVEVEANGSLRPRIVAGLEAEGVAVVANGARATGEIRIVAVDISQPDYLRRLRDRLAQGAARRVVGGVAAMRPARSSERHSSQGELARAGAGARGCSSRRSAPSLPV